MPNTALTIKDILGPVGLLARSLEGFEFRDAQVQMGLLIQEALQKKVPAIVEAGTGTGKTFGYLVPLILSGKKAVVSTGTKNLQEQVFHKDIPLLRKATNLEIDAMIMKGRRNYLCLHRYHQFFSQASFLKTDLGKLKQRLEAWLKNTEFADRSELSWLADDDAFWDALSSTSDQCLGSECMFLDKCFLGRLRNRAAKAKIIIVNHYLFFADLKVKKGGFGEVIPRFQVAVFDEAHTVEEIATAYLGEALSTNQLLELVNDFEKEIKGVPDIDKSKLNKHLNAIKAGSESLRALFNSQEEKGRLDHDTLSVIRKGPAREIRRGLKYLQEKANVKELDHPAFQAMVARARDMDELVDQITRERKTNWLNWYEKRKRSLVLHASPLDVSDRMNELLYEKVQTVVFTSATLSTNKTFDYVRSRLGLPVDTMEGDYPSHFDFENQTLMYIPKNLPKPNTSDFAPEVAKRVADILERTNGRALVLFTSYHNLNLVFQILEGRIPYTLYRQGDAPRSVLLDEFKRDINSVLLATTSFWQGVDVPGESLSCLIIDKLPFDSPGEPLVAARIDAIRDQGGNPFMEYQVPAAIISFKQGLGRLIRNNSDRGILSVLDTRIMTSRYGRFFLDSLPHIPISHDLSEISRFFE
ncbi:MAG: ATP-dependent DNA helicase [Desulfobacteraceae bacterium]|nr:MAG: ATP-dependent DNA helicase [Desulfobacteraceae bacterium]